MVNFMMGLDQFYTSPKLAEFCFGEIVKCLSVDEGDVHFIEPSAGDGVFYDLLPLRRRTGIDLDPQHKGIKQGDFLKWKPSRGRKKNRVVIGNPPFGKRGDMAVDFINHASCFADTIGFILPKCFCKYAIQKQLPYDLRLVKRRSLPRDAFRLPNGKPYTINTVFQVWTRVPKEGSRNYRRMNPEPIRHPDFVLYQYNNTREAEKYFRNPFDFAVPCQGWQDYTRKETNPNKCERNKQWMLIKGDDNKIINRLKKIDYNLLAMRVATMVPGFRKCDLVGEYVRCYG